MVLCGRVSHQWEEFGYVYCLSNCPSGCEVPPAFNGGQVEGAERSKNANFLSHTRQFHMTKVRFAKMQTVSHL